MIRRLVLVGLVLAAVTCSTRTVLDARRRPMVKFEFADTSALWCAAITPSWRVILLEGGGVLSEATMMVGPAGEGSMRYACCTSELVPRVSALTFATDCGYVDSIFPGYASGAAGRYLDGRVECATRP